MYQYTSSLQILATEFFKESKDLIPTIFSDIFLKRSVQYNLCHDSEFCVPNVKNALSVHARICTLYNVRRVV